MDDAGERHDHRTNHGIKTDRGGTPSQKGTRQQPLIKLMAARKSPPRRGNYGNPPESINGIATAKIKRIMEKTHAPEITSNHRLQATSQPYQPTMITGVASNSRNAPGTESRETNYSKRGNIGEYEN